MVATLSRDERAKRLLTEVIAGLAYVQHWHPSIRAAIQDLRQLQALLGEQP